MPYSYGYRKKRKRYNRRKRSSGGASSYFMSGASKALYIAQKALAVGKYLKGLINVEKHYFDTNASGPVDNSGSISLLSGIGQGDDVNQRQGNSVLAKTLLFRTFCNLNTSAESTQLRFIIIKDLENQGSTPSVSDVIGPSPSVITPLNVDHTSRYQVLRDKVLTLKKDMNSYNMKQFITVNDHLKFTGSGTTDVYKNAIYLILISDQATNTPSVTWNSRVGYYDN